MLEQTAYLPEIIGVVLIIASLEYVAQHVKQNTEMLRANHANDFVSHANGLISPITSGRDFAEF